MLREAMPKGRRIHLNFRFFQKAGTSHRDGEKGHLGSAFCLRLKVQLLSSS